ncbi:thioesterase II family protein [Hamadaea tsunoensis]|uniref:thioesterase II family protein n=1 Tax=Hamadaea tsunoensis TaxID=53368 RepID=UPI00040F51D1|nr:alpha/beta fold hydrolase [Hamadaea tsunoensis]
METLLTHPGVDPGWTVRWQPAPAARLRLFCVPHAGGGAAVYRMWGKDLGPDVEVIAIRPPGRESRFTETPISDMDTMVTDLVAAVQPLLDRPHAWFGHSMGAFIAFEACRRLRETGVAEPMALLVSGKEAPHRPTHVPPVHAASAAELRRRLRLLGGTPAELLDDEAVLVRALPLLRADFALTEQYEHRLGPPMDLPITVFGGTHDPMVAAGELEHWARYTTEAFGVRLMSGGHFFLHDHPEQMLALVYDALARQLRRMS